MSNLHAKDAKKYDIKTLCELLGVSKQAYYQYDDERLMSHIAMESFALEFAMEIRKSDPGMGINKIWYMYQVKFRGQRDILGRDRFTNLLVEAGMKVRLKIRKPKTTDSSHGLPVYPNLIKSLIPTRTNQLWVSDITYIEIWRGPEDYIFCYLSLILDAYSREIIGWCVGDALTAIYPLKALRMAIGRLAEDGPRPIHHSDRGVQYASSDYINELKTNDINISMTETGDPKDNAQAERINNTMKNELLKGMRFSSIDEVRAAVAKAVDFYNNERPHMSINMMTPAEASECAGDIKKHWHSYRDEAIKALAGL